MKFCLLLLLPTLALAQVQPASLGWVDADAALVMDFNNGTVTTDYSPYAIAPVYVSGITTYGQRLFANSATTTGLRWSNTGNEQFNMATNQNFTAIAVAIGATSDNNWHPIINKDDNGALGQSRTGYELARNRSLDGSFGFAHIINKGTSYLAGYSSGTKGTGVTMRVWVKTRNSGTISLYDNGVLIQAVGGTTLSISNSASLTVGGRWDNAVLVPGFNGTISYVAIIRRALSAAEIQQQAEQLLAQEANQ